MKNGGGGLCPETRNALIGLVQTQKGPKQKGHPEVKEHLSEYFLEVIKYPGASSTRRYMLSPRQFPQPKPGIRQSASLKFPERYSPTQVTLGRLLKLSQSKSQSWQTT